MIYRLAKIDDFSGSGAGEPRSPTKFRSVVPIRVNSSANGNSEHDPPVGGLKDISVALLELPTDDNMAAFDEPHRPCQRLPDDGVCHLPDPRDRPR